VTTALATAVRPATEVHEFADAETEHEVTRGDQLVERLGEQNLIAQESQHVVCTFRSVLYRLLDGL
jgi:hypothetical protein